MKIAKKCGLEWLEKRLAPPAAAGFHNEQAAHCPLAPMIMKC
jgi:hypothetical protein